MKLKLVLVAAFTFVVCSGASCPDVIKHDLINLGLCTAKCGVGAADNTITQYGQGQSIDGAAVGWDALDCVMACAENQGVVTIIDAINNAKTPVKDWKAQKALLNKAVPPTFRIAVEPLKK